MSRKIKASIIGATGYTGLETLRFLLNHPHVQLVHLPSHSHPGEKLSAIWPHLKDVCDITLSSADPQTVAKESDVVFLALPHHESQKIVPSLMRHTKIIDLSGDFRLKNLAAYERYYGHKHEYPEGIKDFVYGLTELNSSQIAKAQNVANPGCFAITAQLALLPLKSMMRRVSVLAVTGSSGSGKTPTDDTHHPLRGHNMKSYKINVHQHIPEINQTIGLDETTFSFVPTSGPFTRGIHLTAFVELNDPAVGARAAELFEKTYAKAPFVRLKKNVQLAEVVGSNFCDIAVIQTPNGLIVQTVIDNLAKGAGGNAVHNMNLMFGLKETLGLITMSPLFP